jgi:hypothetical protein
MCKDNKKCECNKNDDVDKNVNEFMKDFKTHGLVCGNKIADIVKELHPDALVIVPLYRSCIVIVQSDEEMKDGVCTLHSYADPHWLGGDIDVDTLKSDDFHFEFCIRGDRQGAVVNKKCDENVDDKPDEDEGHKIVEHDEN